MGKMLCFRMIVFILSMIAFREYAFPWNEDTHRILSEYAAKTSILEMTKGDYLKHLGFNSALDEKLKWNKEQTVREWLSDGAFFEDAGTKLDAIIGRARFTNHFHNPLKSWNQAGLSYLQHGESSVLWAQDSNKQKKSLGGDWSWQNVRSLYYYALTAQAESDRQKYFANTFDGLGHQMHLLQDTAVPDHVRNDAHPEDALFGKDRRFGSYYFETWAKEKFII